MKEFLDYLYKTCTSSKDSGVDALFDVIPALLGERKFDAVNTILEDIDLARVHNSTMYSLTHLVSSYINQLPQYRNFYQRCREEYARRGEASERISDLFDRFKDGGDPARIFDPDAPPYKSPDQKGEEKLDAAIARAERLGDKDIVDYLHYYKAEMERYKERDRKFRDMRFSMGEEEMRKRCIKSLREVADKLEESTGCWPGIYYCDLPEDPLLKKTFIDGIEVTISYPWPG